VLLGGVFAGLTLGLMGLDASLSCFGARCKLTAPCQMVNLQVLSVSGTEVEQKQAAKVLSLLQRGRHWVLVVLLLSNVIGQSFYSSGEPRWIGLAVNESLPIFLDSVLGGGVMAVVSSTALIVICTSSSPPPSELTDRKSARSSLKVSLSGTVWPSVPNQLLLSWSWSACLTVAGQFD
jgi:hypothetical protein